MYLDQLDTVRFDANKTDITDSYVYAEASMMKNIVLGNQITLSQTQLFDSRIILQLLGNDSFVHLLEKNIINVALFHQDCATYGYDLKEITIAKLRRGINGDTRNPFYFSGIDGLSKEKIYSDNPIKNIEIPRKMAIEILQNNGESKISDFALEHRHYFESLKNFAKIISVISPTINKQKLITHHIYKWTMGEFIRLHLQIAEVKYPDYFYKDYIQILRELYNRLLKAKQENYRSNYYMELHKGIYKQEDVVKIKSIVDFYYNMIVAMSIENKNSERYELTFDSKIFDGADEQVVDDVMVAVQGSTNSKIGYSQVQKEHQETILPNIENGILTWEMFDKYTDILSNAEIMSVGRNIKGNLYLTAGTIYNKIDKPTTKEILTDIISSVAGGIAQNKFGPLDNVGTICVRSFIDAIINLGIKGVDEAFSKSKLEEEKVKQVASRIKKSLKGDKK